MENNPATVGELIDALSKFDRDLKTHVYNFHDRGYLSVVVPVETGGADWVDVMTERP